MEDSRRSAESRVAALRHTPVSQHWPRWPRVPAPRLRFVVAVAVIVVVAVVGVVVGVVVFLAPFRGTPGIV